MMTMERLKPEAQRQIISDFYQKNVAKGRPYTVKHFRAMGLKKTQITPMATSQSPWTPSSVESGKRSAKQTQPPSSSCSGQSRATSSKRPMRVLTLLSTDLHFLASTLNFIAGFSGFNLFLHYLMNLRHLRYLFACYDLIFSLFR